MDISEEDSWVINRWMHDCVTEVRWPELGMKYVLSRGDVMVAEQKLSSHWSWIEGKEEMDTLLEMEKK